MSKYMTVKCDLYLATATKPMATGSRTVICRGGEGGVNLQLYCYIKFECDYKNKIK
jgi:hypothetical protein